MKFDALVLVARNPKGKELLRRYGVQDEIRALTENVEQLLSQPDVAYVEIGSRCFVKEYHQLEKSNAQL